MPIKSKAQLRWLGYAEKAGKIKKGALAEWLSKTRSVKNLPERIKKKRK